MIYGPSKWVPPGPPVMPAAYSAADLALGVQIVTAVVTYGCDEDAVRGLVCGSGSCTPTLKAQIECYGIEEILKAAVEAKVLMAWTAQQVAKIGAGG